MEDGKKYIYRKNFLGKIVDKAELPSEPFDNTNIVKIRCAECGEEYIVFDNRIHGYDAFVGENKHFADEQIAFEQIKFKNSEDNVAEIDVRMINQHSFEEFNDESDEDHSIEEYSNAFENIDIYARVKDLNDKKGRCVLRRDGMIRTIHGITAIVQLESIYLRWMIYPSWTA